MRARAAAIFQVSKGGDAFAASIENMLSIIRTLRRFFGVNQLLHAAWAFELVTVCV